MNLFVLGKTYIIPSGTQYKLTTGLQFITEVCKKNLKTRKSTYNFVWIT